jgi:hypothetical protein
VYVEIWVEKDALAGVIYEETKLWDVPLMVTRGFPSETYLYEAAQSIKEEDRTAFLYYFGDHDPSGVYIDLSTQRRLREMAPKADIRFERVAVLPSQIAEWSLPTRPTKKTDSRAKTFKGASVDLDALPAHRPRELVRDCIERHVDKDAYEVLLVAEKSEREILTRLSQQLEVPDVEV